MRVYKYDVEYNDSKLPMLVHDGEAEYDGRSKLESPEKVADFLTTQLHLDRKTEEHAIVIALDNRNRPIGVFDLSHGSVDQAIVGMRELMQRLLLIGAVRYFIAHNHPSGDELPSKMDIELTQKLKNASDIMDIPMLDHIIIADGGYYSFRKDNFLWEEMTSLV